VFGGDVHVVWEKFCRYFDVEPRTVPVEAGTYHLTPEAAVALPRQPPGSLVPFWVRKKNAIACTRKGRRQPLHP